MFSLEIRPLLWDLITSLKKKLTNQLRAAHSKRSSIKIVMEMVSKSVAMARFLTDNPDILLSFCNYSGAHGLCPSPSACFIMLLLLRPHICLAQVSFGKQTIKSSIIKLTLKESSLFHCLICIVSKICFIYVQFNCVSLGEYRQYFQRTMQELKERISNGSCSLQWSNWNNRIGKKEM